MSIPHWGMFPGLMTVGEQTATPGIYYAVWEPCDFDYLVQWQ